MTTHLPAPAPAIPKPKESHYRSVIKGISWRVLGTMDTMVISWFMTGSIKLAAAIGGTEVFTKIGLYYLHERAWQRVPRSGVKRFVEKIGFGWLVKWLIKRQKRKQTQTQD
jgi:uncharacterized membrane protein